MRKQEPITITGIGKSAGVKAPYKNHYIRLFCLNWLTGRNIRITPEAYHTLHQAITATQKLGRPQRLNNIRYRNIDDDGRFYQLYQQIKGGCPST